jgi:anti-anti-sigma factor
MKPWRGKAMSRGESCRRVTILRERAALAPNWMERIVAIHNVDGLELNVDRGPNWLFVKLRPGQSPRVEEPQIADKLWSISSRHFIYRLVLELEDLEEMPSGMMGQLVMLQERLAQCGGALRICGLSPECEESLHNCRLDTALPNHASREAAVMGSEHASASNN